LSMVAALAVFAQPALAAQHRWFVSQAYSDIQGRVQFIEFIGRADGQHQFVSAGNGHMVQTNNRTLEITSDLPSRLTGGAHFVMASQSFQDLADQSGTGFKADYVFPDGFFNLLDPTGERITFLPDREGGPTEVVAGIFFPLDGRSVSRNMTPATDTRIDGMDASLFIGPAGTAVPNLVRNFSGQTFVVPDTDTDGVVDLFDNCPTAANTAQTNFGGVATAMDVRGVTRDGLGDACQCGDVTNDGRVTQADAVALRNALAAVPPLASVETLPGFAKCNVGDTDGCSDEDAVRIENALTGIEPGIANVCLLPAALPTIR
jgi:hypothetical protein